MIPIAASPPTYSPAASPSDHRARAHDLIQRFLGDFGPSGELRRLAQARDAQLHQGLGVVEGQSIQLGADYDPRTAMTWKDETRSFVLDGKALSVEQATTALADALRSRPALSQHIEHTLEYQRRSIVEGAQHDFREVRDRYVADLNLRHALHGESQRHGGATAVPPMFQRADAARVTRAFHGLQLGRDRVEAECLAAVRALPNPRTARERVSFLTRVGYAPEVADAIVHRTPHVAEAIVALARQSARLPKEAKEGWTYFREGDLAFLPVKLMRGIDAETYDPRWVMRFERDAGREFSFFSDQLGYPFMRSIWSYTGGKAKPDREKGLIVEFQVPAFLVMNAENNHPVLVQKMVPDQEAFVHRVGAVPFSPAASRISGAATEQNIGMVQWRSAREAAQVGWIAAPNPEKPPARLEVFDPAAWVRE